MMIRSTLFERLQKKVMVWFALYPSVLLVLALAGDMLRDWLFPFRVLGVTRLIVPIVANITELAVRTTTVGTIAWAWMQRRSPIHESPHR